MSRDHEELFALLNEGFEAHEVREREQGGRRFRYLKVATVMNRLDDVLGPANWEDEYLVIDETTIQCALTVTLPDGRRVTKRAFGNRKGHEAKPGDVGRLWKSAASDALKSAAAKYGVGRYLRECGTPRFVEPALRRVFEREEAARLGTPQHALGTPAAPPAEAPPATAPVPTRVNGAKYPVPPKTGGQLYAWAKDQEQLYEVGLVKYLTGWARREGFPERMVAWAEDEVRLGYAEATRKLAARKGEAHDGALAG